MTTTNTQLLVQQFLTCLTQRDITKLTALFDEEVDWYIPGNETLVPWTGRRNNRTEVQSFFQLLWQNTEPVSAKIDHILTDESVAIITGEFSTKMLATDKIVDSVFFIQITFKNGLITRYRLLEDSYAVSLAMSR
ncbi:nuclear transport factor 2 family protein [Pedobacter sp. UBA5917]|jgi:ketosteroid isomerase-like protein|uniref:nuclear transport factor 2 family protein n=1 Tax=Pedobacter sp. UBA5917 TaxID=1947061 RepID=UPI0025D8F4ED|nr:nuclear transport factor 2 family protein [Pedobacter sp. UBA5917]